MSHTPEPWQLSSDGWNVFGDGNDPWGIANLLAYEHQGEKGIHDDEQKANARRIVACVNAMAGVTTSELEAIEPDAMRLVFDEWRHKRTRTSDPY